MPKKIDREKVKELLDEELDDQEIAEELGSRRTTIQKIRTREFGIKRKRGKKIDRDKVKELLDEGLNDREVAERLGVQRAQYNR